MKTTKNYQGTLSTYDVRKLYQIMRDMKANLDFRLIANKRFAYSLYCDDDTHRTIIFLLSHDMRSKKYKLLVSK